MGRTTSRYGLLTLLVASSCLFVACEGTPNGPSLADTPLTNIVLRPTLANDATACCCHVTGQLTNNNSVPVHVTIKFAAFQTATSPDPFASILYFVEDLQPRSTHNVDASGFVVPCNAINPQLLRKEVSVRGLTFPPF